MNFLPGWFPSGGAFGGVTLLTFFDSSISGAQTISMPAGIKSGDVAVLFDNVANGGTPTTVVPTGFTSAINTTDSAVVRGIISYKVLNGSETTITGMTGDSLILKILMVFRGDSPVVQASSASANGQTTNVAPSNQSVTAGSGLPPLLVLAGYYTNPVAGFSIGFSPSQDGIVNGSDSTRQRAYYKIYNIAPADTTISMNDAGQQNMMQSFYLQCS